MPSSLQEWIGGYSQLTAARAGREGTLATRGGARE